ncbi:MAG: hypothetical protein A3I44_01160 [Candidatus Sungbacteria bacterium RIFCSPLOWO2_02_FULL_51_17]|uniref:EfeO-type cupredoxin-like domain-containing protein n=1 Tax=Candidatus Sungbacteria bacterium RIFCSPHIGHO2_02_FULL_51_29 TaxID=1802273 RepID=A0A1G2KSD1_9BACT|nr:MAG: hypothetical protein A2676_00865 [Candidatus Sungbacteria bacterium RIFCSPHIGHO2_01_FULL_51_22]OHA02184.1 MAG: hypothetical protein A3C16_00660 [Candidatus Sungbacteria bacterium RIFCSPHIGHO2_02_FULL_51_29]OHA07294.1 MAG: hypothetical protein A3B29_04285 [Candidatus Sungbacteria bacterium RIFCSPLOWO2_01_FULL_51_34]OHA10730.1 MAG: hypothetical protein A3I44_01160 [Candidatus Sungbacteria bacterium RIFCSPLOWO2_02_FULL_51_17]
MNKYFILGGSVIIILVAGIMYRTFLLPEASRPCSGGITRNFTVTAEKDKWNFVPQNLEAECGDKIVMTVVNEDEYDHGIAIDALGVSQRMPAKSTITVEFTVTQEGEFPYYCSVPCGEGHVDGKLRTHFDMIGTLKVKPARGPAMMGK